MAKLVTPKLLVLYGLEFSVHLSLSLILLLNEVSHKQRSLYQHQEEKKDLV
jgi:hypothetical protein